MHPFRQLTGAAVFCTAFIPYALSQSDSMPRDYRGVEVHIPGIFVTPVANAPFSAKVDIVSKQLLPDGTYNIKTTTNRIARQSSGRIYNERRVLVSTSFHGEARLLSAHIYDPSSRLNIFLDPQTRLARETVLQQPPTPSPNSIRTPPTTPR
jgi:hypothetical protein